MYFRVYFDTNDWTETIKDDQSFMNMVNREEITEGLENGSITIEDIRLGRVRYKYEFEKITNIVTETNIGVPFISFINLDLKVLKVKFMQKIDNSPKHTTITYLTNLFKEIQDIHIYFLLDEYMRGELLELDFDDARSLEEIIKDDIVMDNESEYISDNVTEILDQLFNHLIEVQEIFKNMVSGCLEYERSTLLEKYYEYYQSNKEFLEQFENNLYAIAYTPNKNKLGKIVLYQEFSSSTIEAICFLEFIKLVENDIGIKKCAIKSCNKFFIPEGRIDTLYCDNCRKDGAKIAYKQKIENNDFLKLYNKEYQRRYAKIRNYDKAMKKTKLKEVQLWVKKAKTKIDEPNLTIEQFEKWIEEEKESEKNGR